MARNAEVLGLIINKWAQPLVGTFINEYMQGLPFVQVIQNKIRSTGWVSPNWSILPELSPLMESVTGNIIAPFVSNYLSQFDDAMLPKLAHSIVDGAIKNGELKLFEGKVVFEGSDLRSLKQLLDLNMPYNPENDITIKTE
jgi:hypothetical protein